MKWIKVIYCFTVIMLLTIGCEKKIDTSQLTGPTNANITGDTVYVQLNPPWTGYNQPQDIIVGREPFIYVADTDNDRVVM